MSFRRIVDFIFDALSVDISDARKARMLNYLNIRAKNNDMRQTINDFAEQNVRWINGLTGDLYRAIEERPYPTFVELINKY